MARAAAQIAGVEIGAFTIPTDAQESDGTFAWNDTTLVTVEVEAEGVRGFGYTYSDPAAALLIRHKFAPLLAGRDAFAIASRWDDLHHAVRNLGRSGIASTAISAVDVALWDLKARLLDVSLAALLGPARDSVPVYGSGGFTSYDDAQLARQFSHWREEGIGAMKMKVGRTPERDLERVRMAREAAGDSAELMVDANGAFDRKMALVFAEVVAGLGVTWFEEPVTSDDLPGLRLLRDRAPADLEITTGEYGYTLDDFRALLEAQAVDVLQADATRCGGVTGFLQVAALCEAFHVPLSSHTAPALHLSICAALPSVRHMEWFHDHVRIEHRLIDGAPTVHEGVISPDLQRPGHGLALRREEARHFAAPF